MKKKVYVGISGGVDSAVTAALLQEQGYDVTGVFMKNWSGEDFGIDNNCPWKEDQEDTIQICKTLGIPHKTYNFEKEYREFVISNFFEEYNRGNTPNPDVLCNKFIKFDCFLKKALEEGADYIATGHYSFTKDGRLYKAKDTNKDQTYFLHQLTNEQLKHSLFPLGGLLKPEVRALAHKFKLPVADKKDSQGICFIGKVDIKEFLETTLKKQDGNIVDGDTGKVVGHHQGVWFYTIGQREGLYIGGAAKPYFVAEKDLEKNILYVVQGKDNPRLWKNIVSVSELHLINETSLLNDNYTASIRYRSQDTPVKVTQNENGDIFEFSAPQWAPAIGQSLVLFQENECLGGGVISEIH